MNFSNLHDLSQGRGVADLVLPSKLGGMLASGKPVLVTADDGTELFFYMEQPLLFLQGIAKRWYAKSEGLCRRAPIRLSETDDCLQKFSVAKNHCKICR